LNSIQTKYHNLNPEFHQIWCSPDGNEEIFDAMVTKTADNKYKAIKISSRQLTVRLKKGIYEKYALNTTVKVKLHFYLYGLIAEIIN